MNSSTEDELDIRVSNAILRAERIKNQRSDEAGKAWHEVMICEQQLAEITPASSVPGGIARVGAVAAALASGNRPMADTLAARYLGEATLSPERRRKIEWVFQQYPVPIKRPTSEELESWLNQQKTNPQFIFPLSEYEAKAA